jgi:hypothetical protein
MSKFLRFYTGLIILTIIISTLNTFLYDRSIGAWIFTVIFYSFLWGFVYVISKGNNKIKK